MMKIIKAVIVMLIISFTLILGCEDNNRNVENINNLSTELEVTRDKNKDLSKQLDDLDNQLTDLEIQVTVLQNQKNDLERVSQRLQNEMNELESVNMGLKEKNKNSELKENEIKLDLRIPMDVLKIVYKHFEAIDEENIEKLEETLIPKIDEEHRAYQLWDYGKEQKIKPNALTYQFERTSTKSELIVIEVRYNNNLYRSFALRNKNNEGWEIYDID